MVFSIDLKKISLKSNKAYMHAKNSKDETSNIFIGAGSSFVFIILLEPQHENSNNLTSVDSDEPLQPPFKLRNSKWCSVSSLTTIEYSSD